MKCRFSTISETADRALLNKKQKVWSAQKNGTAPADGSRPYYAATQQ
jgi:hypothetical protein